MIRDFLMPVEVVVRMLRNMWLYPNATPMIALGFAKVETTLAWMSRHLHD